MSKKKKNLYEQVMDKLKLRILAGEFDGVTAFTTEDKIIHEYEVSRITAVRALNELERENIIRRKQGKGSYVTRDAKQYIKMASDKNVTVQKKNGTKRIALVLPYNRNFGSMNECISGINEVLNETGYCLSVYDAERDIDRQREILLDLAKQEVEGVICLPVNSRDHLEIYSYYTQSDKPFLLLDQYIDCLPVKSVVSDNRAGSTALCDSFFEKGHTKIGYVTHGSISEASSIRDRYFGYLDSLGKHGQQVNMDYVEINISERSKRVYRDIYEKTLFAPASKEERRVIKRDTEEEMYMQYMKDMLLRLTGLGVTAVLCQNDWVALEIAMVCEALGIKTPQQLEIGGFDNVPELTNMKDGIYISTVEQDFKALGRRAGERLLEVLENGASMLASIDFVPTKTILRNTKR